MNKSYDHLNNSKQQLKQSELIVVLRDFNAKVENQAEDSVVRDYGFGKRDNRRGRLVAWAKIKITI